MQIRSGDVFVGTTQDGVVVVNTDKVRVNPIPPPVEIEAVLIERRATDFQDPIALRTGDDNLEIHCTSISFVKPE